MALLYQALEVKVMLHLNGRVQTTGVSGTATLAVGDEIKVQLFFGSSTNTEVIENQACVFSMFRLAI